MLLPTNNFFLPSCLYQRDLCFVRMRISSIRRIQQVVGNKTEALISVLAIFGRIRVCYKRGVEPVRCDDRAV